MPIQINFTVTNDNPDTIWNKLVAKLGRDPTNDECRDEIHRLLEQFRMEREERAKR